MMATIIKKIKKGIPYWYAVKSQRVNGKPRIVWQKYLGRVDDIVAAIGARINEKPKEVEIWEFAGIAALLSAAEELDLVKTIDQVIPKRNQGPSIGQFMLLAALNRALAPQSKLQIGKWYSKTILKRLWRFHSDNFSSQRFWDSMDKVSEKSIVEIEKLLVSKLVEQGKVVSHLLLYDTTNFATFISFLNDRNTLAQPGHSKKKRKDLRIVGYAQIVSQGSSIPLFHEVYQGNSNDQKVFRENILSLVERYQQIMDLKKSELTLVFDKGNRGVESFDILDDSGVHFVSSLMRTHYLLFLEQIPIEMFKQVSSAKLPGVRAYRCRKEINGVERTVIITLDESCYSKEISDLSSNLAKAVTKLNELSLELYKAQKRASKINKPTVEGTKNKVEAILSRHKLSNITFGKKKIAIIDYKVDLKDYYPRLKYSINQEQLNNKIAKHCGKTILFTSRNEWTTEKIICSYREQYEIEDTFRNMNNWDFLRWQPMYHWTDQKIRVHGFYCYLATLLTSLVKQTVNNTIELSKHDMLKKLSDIKETILIYPQGKKAAPPKLQRVYSKLDSSQKKLSQILNLTRWQV